jgi:hypothetical protein
MQMSKVGLSNQSKFMLKGGACGIKKESRQKLRDIAADN